MALDHTCEYTVAKRAYNEPDRQKVGEALGGPISDEVWAAAMKHVAEWKTGSVKPVSETAEFADD